MYRFDEPRTRPVPGETFVKREKHCETQFLNWDQPLLPSALGELRKRFTDDAGCLDGSQFICVLPTSLSADRLRGYLLADSSLDTCPEILTVGRLAERLFDPPSEVALDLEQTLAWARALQAMTADQLRPLIPVSPGADLSGQGPAEERPMEAWIDLGGTLRHLHGELWSHRLTFDDVARAAETDSEQRRWQLLSTVFAGYLNELDAAGLCDPHIALASAVAQRRCRCDKTIVLIGTSDLSDALIEMLHGVDSDIVSLVAAPENQSHRFGPFGVIKTEAWLDYQLPVHDQNFLSASDVVDQSQAAIESIRDWQAKGSLASADVTVGVTDESQVAPLEVQLRGHDFSPYRHLGWTVSETAVGRLLNLISTYIRRRTWQSLAALVRHGEVSSLISSKLDVDSHVWLTSLDRLLSDHYPVRLDDPLPAQAQQIAEMPCQIAETIQNWLCEFLDADNSSAERTISVWSAALDRCLGHLYGHAVTSETAAARTLGRHRTIRAVTKAREVLDRLSRLNSRLDITTDGSTAIEMLTGRLADVRFGETLRKDDIEIAGWLDLALDPAPALIVVGFNHPFVPAAVTSDPFLPGGLRMKLKLADNDRRFSRDVYATQLMLATRKHTRFIVGQIAADGSPTPPSRLLAAAPPQDLAPRILRLLKEDRTKAPITHRWSVGPEVSALPIPRLPDSGERPPIESMSVTSFKDYLICPYRFYLRHVLQQKPLSDDGSELAANQFGDLIHNTLDLFGNHPQQRDEPNAERIYEYLVEHLHDYAHRQYGDAASVSVTLQVAQAKRRLAVVAQRQAERVADGWRIVAAEKSAGAEQKSGVEVNGRWMTLKGRFDRIDHHPESDRWAILDYKTHGYPPEKKHLKRKLDGGYEWLELQLPLYRMMAPFLDIPADPKEVELGYFNISQKDAETRINLADFDEELMHQAEELIHQIISNVHDGKFEPTAEPVQYDDYDMILQAGLRTVTPMDGPMANGAEAEK